MSRIEQLISEIEEYIDTCKYQALSNTKTVVNSRLCPTARSLLIRKKWKSC